MNNIISVNHHEIRPVLQFDFRQGFTLFMRYIDFDQYSYHIQFSKSEFNRIRYDNYDDRSRNERNALTSEMVGISELDIPKLVEVIKQFI